MSRSPTPSESAGTRPLHADIVDSIDIPIVVVGGGYTVVKFNPAAATLLSLAPTDLGRRLHEFPLLTHVKHLEQLCGDAMESGASSQCEVRDATNGSWFVLRIAPYMESEQRIDGAVLTLQNITAFRASLEQAIYEREYTKAIINTVIDPLVVLDDDCRVQAANQAFYTKFQVSRDQAHGAKIYEVGSRDWEVPRLEKFLKEACANHESDAEFEHEFPAVGQRTVLLNARRLSRGSNLGQMTLLTLQDITERKQREEARRRAEEELRDFVETAAIGMHWLGPEGKILWANQTELDLLGYAREEYIGHHIAEFHANLRVADDILGRLSRGESLREYPARLRCKNGSIRHGLVTSSGRFDGGKFVHRCFTRDITEQVRADEQRLATERTLREKDGRFREMIDALPVPIYTTDAHGRLTHFNPACVEFSGRTPELGTDQWCVSWKLFWPDGRSMLHDECPMAVALKEGRIPSNVEAVAERPDGTRISFIPYPTPLRDPGGRIIGGINMLLDITERKRAEMDTASLAAIVESSDDAIISKSLDGVITSWNRSAEQMFGYTPEEAIGQHITLIIPPDRHDEEKRIIERIRSGERIDHFETVRQRKGGSMLDISVTVSPVRDSAGKIIGASKVARDISARKRAQQTLRENEDRLRALADHLELKVQDRTHELEQRNLEVLEKSERLRELSTRLLQTQDEERRRIARDLHDSVGQIVTVLGMHLASITQRAVKPEIRKAAEESHEMVRQLSKEIRTISYLLHPPLLDEAGLSEAIRWYMKGLAERSGLNIQLDIPQDFGRLPSDVEVAIFRIVQECLTNIHRHSGGKTATIRLIRNASTVSLEIQDDGSGIPKDTLTAIRTQRSGVGMTGMRERVRQLGGNFDIQSNSNGTMVSVTLPLAANPTTSAEITQAASAAE
jgi:PAS domain S-box-containing protein